MKETIVLWFNKVKNKLLNTTTGSKVESTGSAQDNSVTFPLKDCLEFDEQISYSEIQNLKLWQILENALTHLRQPGDTEALKSPFICDAIIDSCKSNHPNDLAKHKEARDHVMKLLDGYATLEGWLRGKGHVASIDVFVTDEGFAKLQLTRKMWLLDMIAECKAKDI